MRGWLRGWPNIAKFCGCSVRTVKRYYYEIGMPVYCVGTPIGAIALAEELNAWLKIYSKLKRKPGHNPGPNPRAKLKA